MMVTSSIEYAVRIMLTFPLSPKLPESQVLKEQLVTAGTEVVGGAVGKIRQSNKGIMVKQYPTLQNFKHAVILYPIYAKHPSGS